MIDNTWRWAEPYSEEETAAFLRMCEEFSVAKELAKEAGLFWTDWEEKIDEARSMMAELRAFAAVWDLCAVSQGHGIDG